MTFSRYTLPCVILLIVAACSTGDKAYQVAEREALSPFELPAYNGIIDIMKGESFATIPAGKLVYVTDSHATGNDIEFVRVVWGDSTGYVRQDLIMQTGKLAVITSAGTDIHEIHIYSDKELTREMGFILDSWTLAVAIPGNGSTTEVLIQGEQGPLRGFYTSDDLHFDPVDIEFYNAYRNAEGNPAAMYDLSGDAHLNNSSLSQRLFGAGVQANNVLDERGDAETGEGLDGDDVYREGGAEDGDVPSIYSDGTPIEQFVEEQNWYRDGVELTDDKAPAIIRKYFLLEDGSEMEAERHSLENAMPKSADYSSNDTRKAKKVRFEVTPNGNTMLHFQVDTWAEGYDQYNTSFRRDFEAVAGKPYSVFVEDIGDNTMILCSSIRVKVTADGAEAIATMVCICYN